jgi:outer membrane lipoprotein-sorting protein
MKKHHIALAGILVLCMVSLVSAQTLEDVITRAANAMGGMQKLENINTMTMKMRGTMRGAMEMQMTMYTMKPGMYRMEMDMMGQHMVTVSDGTDAWMEMMGRTMDIPAGQGGGNNMMGQSFGEAILKLKEQGATYAGREDFNGVQCDVIEFTPEGQSETSRMYFDANSGLMAGIRSSAGGQNVEVRINAYSDVDGFKFPAKMETFMGSESMMEMEIYDVQINPALEASMFQRK